jgi:hypothetical protein
LPRTNRLSSLVVELADLASPQLVSRYLSVATTDVQQGLDPALIVYGGTTGEFLGSNDDADVSELAARVLLQLDQPREIVMRLVSVEGEGDCTIEATATVKLATTRSRGTPEAPPELST